LIGTEGGSTPVGDAGRLRPRRSVCDEEAQLTPHGKRAPWSGNQLTNTKIATKFMITAIFLISGLVNKASLHILELGHIYFCEDRRRSKGATCMNK